MTIRVVLQWLACLLSDEHQVVGAVADGRTLMKVGFHQISTRLEKPRGLFLPLARFPSLFLGTMIPRDRGRSSAIECADQTD
jgi:hypothetical protein